MRDPTPLLILLAFAGIFAIGYVTAVLRGEAMLKRWAERHHHTLIKANYHYFPRGKFLLQGMGQSVFRIKVRAIDGTIRNGYALCGGFWTGMWDERVRVVWDFGDRESD